MDSLVLENTKNRNVVSQKDLRVISCTLHDLLFCNQIPIEEEDSKIFGQLTIPEYQRPYVWKEKQINRLLNDFIEYQSLEEEKSLFYLGSFIIHQDGDKLNIIDGQQRLTTMLLLNSFYENPIVSNVAYNSPLSVENIKRNHSYLKRISNQDYPNIPNVSIANLIDFKDINLTLVITDSEDLAYTFFETQNTGGVRLRGSDIIKSHHLRAIKTKEMIAKQAIKWETYDSYKIEEVIKQLCKIRYWNNNRWRIFPFYRDQKGLKETIIEEFSEKTNRQNIDVSHYFSVIKNEDGKSITLFESHLRKIRQPLYDGNNFMDYVGEYVELFQILFDKEDESIIPKAFYDFKKRLLHGYDGTNFLKELFEISLVTYVSRFGFERLFEVSLWLYRYVYSLRVVYKRNIKEDGVFKFVNNKKLIDKILESYTIDGFLLWLKQFSYEFDTNYTEDSHNKGKHVICLRDYLGHFTNAKDLSVDNKFDKLLIFSINSKIENEREKE